MLLLGLLRIFLLLNCLYWLLVSGVLNCMDGLQLYTPSHPSGTTHGVRIAYFSHNLLGGGGPLPIAHPLLSHLRLRGLGPDLLLLLHGLLLGRLDGRGD